jgi:hypothetical protein
MPHAAADRAGMEAAKLFRQKPSEEFLHFGDVPGQKPVFQSGLVDGFNHRSDQACIFSRDVSKVLVIRMPVQIVIDVPHQVDQTFLLRTIDRIIESQREIV